jgi:predicted hydrocarbon binding protein
MMSHKTHMELDAEKGEAMACFGNDNPRIVIMASEAFVKMMETLNAFGTAAFTMLYMMGQEKGRYEAKKIMEALRSEGTSFTKRQAIGNIVHRLRVTGWGSIRVQRYDDRLGYVTIIVENNPLVLALEINGKSDRPLCHYFRGYWVGVVSEVFERKVNCEEVECMGMGDTFCKFEVRSG